MGWLVLDRFGSMGTWAETCSVEIGTFFGLQSQILDHFSKSDTIFRRPYKIFGRLCWQMSSKPITYHIFVCYRSRRGPTSTRPSTQRSRQQWRHKCSSLRIGQAEVSLLLFSLLPMASFHTKSGAIIITSHLWVIEANRRTQVSFKLSAVLQCSKMARRL